MADNLTPEQRRRNMVNVKSKDTKPELLLRSALHARGLRFRKHADRLPGKPDVVFGPVKVAIFIDGDYWHGWDFEQRRHGMSEYWLKKIGGNMARDRRNRAALRAQGWSVIRVWEHQVMKDLEGTVDRIEKLIRGRRNVQASRRKAG